MDGDGSRIGQMRYWEFHWAEVFGITAEAAVDIDIMFDDEFDAADAALTCFSRCKSASFPCLAPNYGSCACVGQN